MQSAINAQSHEAMKILTLKIFRLYGYMPVMIIVTGFGKTNHIVTIDISRNTDLKY